ncbi:MAG: ParB/RepB/Spo0J family partition protein [Erysipelotrichaceae bacterium]|jgi:ParB family chromosome partitioning protein|nr:ParB/RepB/Spo0J family partition protein [Erysipelotrichaceae bacterium]
MANERKLGKGLGALFGEDLNSVIEEIESGKSELANDKTVLPIDEIRSNPYQPRKEFNPEKLQELADSIAQHGVFTPVLVRKSSVSGYELIAGERRLRAAKMAGLTEIPAIEVDFDDRAMMEIGLVENVQREDLNVIEEANAYQQIIENLHYTQERLAQRVGKSREHITNILRLRKLPAKVQNYVIAGKLTMGHVRPLIMLDADLAEYYADRIVAEGLSVREVEKLIKQEGSEEKETKKKEEDRDLLNVAHLIQRRLQTKVKIDEKNITIAYQGVDDLNRILELLGFIEEG